jgi:hypothetical protein
MEARMFVGSNKALNDFLTRLSYGAPHSLRDFLGSQLAESTRTQFASVASRDFDDVANQAATLRAEGLVDLGQVLDDRQVAEVRGALMAGAVYEGHVAKPAAARAHTFEAVRGRVHYASYEPTSVIEAPHLIELANDPKILKLAESYLGCPPTLYSVNAWWSFPQVQRAKVSQALHRDRDDLRFVTMFVYLTTVTSLCGPHRYVKFSHDQRALAEKLVQHGMSPAEAQGTVDAMFSGTGYQHSEQSEAQLGEYIHTWVGPAGTAILADTYGLHMGKPLQQGERLMFWARYGLGSNDAAFSDDDVKGGIDIAHRVGRQPRARYINRLLSGDRRILDELGRATQVDEAPVGE